MKKWSVILTIIFLLIFTACGNKENNIQTTSGKHTTSASSNVGSLTTGTAATTSTENSTKATANKSTSVKQSVVANQNKSKITSTVTQTTTKKNNSTTASVTKQTAYTPEAWGTTTEKMEAELAEYSQSIGMVYDISFTLESGHWTTPTSSLNWDWQTYKNSICNTISYNKGRGFTEVRVIFEHANTVLRDGSNAEYMQAYIVLK